jgi:hypothetical protein
MVGERSGQRREETMKKGIPLQFLRCAAAPLFLHNNDANRRVTTEVN